jgi:hypothetical protein
MSDEARLWLMVTLNVLVPVWVVLSVWFSMCNYRTMKERIFIVNLISEHNKRMLKETHRWDVVALHAAFGKVSYEKHLWMRYFLRNPMRLYPYAIRKLIPAEYEVMTWPEKLVASIRRST